ncbi:LuxR family transcriptional regulator [Mycobacterium sp. SMC-4]|uniref:helix-turn-helix transcriptional regulator n=1 Tax=Mycobacterium sp. SMC-4 TaxID=2857059 RepID=UPI0021B219C1|nr:LuxR family transcriptional regulator [Mycobacterium sp. SMC-4]
MGVVSSAGEVVDADPPVAGFLDSVAQRPTGLVIEGEAGIGKSTLWLALLEKARSRGYRVLSARVGEAESVMAFSALADLLADVEPDYLAALPGLQRLALDRVLLRAGVDGPATDHRVTAAAFVAVLRALTADGPVVLAIDDTQWLDSSSRGVVEFAARRLQGPCGVLVTERTVPGSGTVARWLHLDRPDGLERHAVRPMSSRALHTMLTQRLGRSFPRPTVLRIAEISGGNPFFALELARALGDGTGVSDQPLPETLAEVVRTRVDKLTDDVRALLLSASCVPNPTVELLASATGATPQHVTALLERAEAHSVVVLEGNRVRFSHPLLASLIYNDAPATTRRATHRVLAGLETHPELRARHLALASATGDEEIFAALDQAGDLARARGAPAAAAELIDLAINLGGDTLLRRLRSAENHFLAGDTSGAKEVLGAVGDYQPPIMRALGSVLLATVHMYDNKHTAAVDLLRSALDDATGNIPVTVQVLLRLSFALHSIGDTEEARRHIRDAVKLAEELGVPGITSAALAWSVQLDFQCGRGLDEKALDRAMELYDSALDLPIIFRAPMINALALSGTGRLEEAHRQLISLRTVGFERGAESDMMAIAGFLAINSIWRGQIAAAQTEAAEAVERAEQLGGDEVLIIPMTVRAAVAAFAGHVEQARADAEWVLEASSRRQSSLADWPGMTLCFLEESLGNHRAALDALDRAFLDPTKVTATELMLSWHLPDVIEAMVGVGQLDDAETLTRALEHNGEQHDRRWMKAVGARCRAMLLAAGGDVTAAERVARLAMAEHESLPMPFERARTALVWGQLQRRLRRKGAAATILTEALETFERLGTPLWAQRAQAELSRTVVSPSDGNGGLTESEQRVAELAASGATNKDIAAAMFITTKTVEHHLTKVYRKLGISSRAELGRRMDRVREG